MSIDNLPYPGEEKISRDRFTQAVYEKSITRLYEEFERAAPRICGSLLFSMKVKLQHAKAIVHGLRPRRDLRYDEQRGYYFEPLQSKPAEHEFTDPTGEGRGFSTLVRELGVGQEIE